MNEPSNNSGALRAPEESGSAQPQQVPGADVPGKGAGLGGIHWALAALAVTCRSALTDEGERVAWRGVGRSTYFDLGQRLFPKAKVWIFGWSRGAFGALLRVKRVRRKIVAVAR
jgi:hypothetical protein